MGLKSLESERYSAAGTQQNVLDGVEAEGPEIVEALRFLLHEGFPNSFRNISASLQDTKASFC